MHTKEAETIVTKSFAKGRETLYTWNELHFACPPSRTFEFARHVDRWPDYLPHYRRVRFLEGSGCLGGLVEMAALRRFDTVGWPVWWVSEMEVDEEESVVRYRHVRGVTKGMEVEWKLAPADGGTRVTIAHEWHRPQVGKLLAKRIIGPVFVQHIADQTLEGLKRAAEGRSKGAAANA